MTDFEWGARVDFNDPEMIPRYLRGDPELMAATPAATVYCEDVSVCRIAEGKLEAIACDHPAHGCHPRLREKYAKVRELLSRLRSSGVVEDGPCPKCGGVGWLQIGTAEARHVVLLSTMVGMWRGIPYKPMGLPLMQSGVTMEAILKGHKPADASSTPGQEGCSCPGIFSGAEGKGEGKGEGGPNGGESGKEG
ncbi:MAG: hypothetical protein ABFD77_01175 [Thermotogota bacterium]